MIIRCPGCGLPDGDGHLCFEALRKALRTLVATAGTIGTCDFCASTVYWIKRPGKLSAVPYDGEGTRHATTCTNQQQQRRPHTSGITVP